MEDYTLIEKLTTRDLLSIIGGSEQVDIVYLPDALLVPDIQTSYTDDGMDDDDIIDYPPVPHKNG